MDEITKTIQEARSSRNRNIFNSFSNRNKLEEGEYLQKAEVNPFKKAASEEKDDDKEDEVDLFEGKGDSNKLMKKMGGEKIKKSEENPFEKAAKEDDIEKGLIYDSISYQDNIKVSKTGKELKEQVNNVLIPQLQDKLQEAEDDADELLKDCGKSPTKDVDIWWVDNLDLKVPFKIYSWDELCVNNNDSPIADTLSAEQAESKKLNLPENDDQAKQRSAYNETVRKICSILKDIKACEILNSLKDNKTFELTTRQVISLGF